MVLFPKEVLGRELATRDLTQWLQKLAAQEGPSIQLEKPIGMQDLPVEHQELQPKSFFTKLFEKLSASRGKRRDLEILYILFILISYLYYVFILYYCDLS